MSGGGSAREGASRASGARSRGTGGRQGGLESGGRVRGRGCEERRRAWRGGRRGGVGRGGKGRRSPLVLSLLLFYSYFLVLPSLSFYSSTTSSQSRSGRRENNGMKGRGNETGDAPTWGWRGEGKMLKFSLYKPQKLAARKSVFGCALVGIAMFSQQCGISFRARENF